MVLSTQVRFFFFLETASIYPGSCVWGGGGGEGCLNPSRKQFEKCALSISELNGFVWTEGRFV